MKLKQYMLLTIGCICVVVIVACTFAKIRGILVNDITQRMQEYSSHERTFVRYLLYEEMEALRSCARIIAANPSYTRKQAVQVLNEIKTTTRFYRIILARPDGVSLTDADEVSSVAQRDYFKSAIEGKETISDRLDFLDGNNEGITFSVPIIQQNKITGILIGAHTRYSFNDVFSTAVFDGNAYCSVVDNAGEIIMYTPSPYNMIDTENVFEFYERVQFNNQETIENLRKKIENGESGSFSFTFGKQKRLVNYKPLGIHNWVILSAVSPDAAFKVNNYIYTLMFSQIVLLAGLFLGFLWYYLASFQRKNAFLVLAAQNQEIINHAIPGGVIKTTLTDDFLMLYKSNGFYELTGFSEQEIQDTFKNAFINFVHPDDRLKMDEIFKSRVNSGSYVLQYRFLTAKGYVWVYESGRTVLDADRKKVLVSVLIDITRVKISLDTLQNKAERDSATELYNKATTRAYIEAALMDGMQSGEFHALAIIDIDNFKQINDTYGHIAGDETILSIAGVLKNMFRKSDVIGRVGGDEFMVLIEHMPDSSFVVEQLQRLCSGVREIKLSADHSLSCSVGVALFPQHGATYDELYKHADTALYEAKRRGKNGFVVYSPDSEPSI